MAEKLLTTKELADALGVCIRTIQRGWKKGRFQPERVTPGGHARYTMEQVEKFKCLVKPENHGSDKSQMASGTSTLPSGMTEAEFALNARRRIRETRKKRTFGMRNGSSTEPKTRAPEPPAPDSPFPWR